MRRLGDLAVGDLLEGVEAVAAGVEGVHEMHDGRVGESRFKGGDLYLEYGLWCVCQLGSFRLVGFELDEVFGDAFW